MQRAKLWVVMFTWLPISHTELYTLELQMIWPTVLCNIKQKQLQVSRASTIVLNWFGSKLTPTLFLQLNEKKHSNGIGDNGKLSSSTVSMLTGKTCMTIYIRSRTPIFQNQVQSGKQIINNLRLEVRRSSRRMTKLTNLTNLQTGRVF